MGRNDLERLSKAELIDLVLRLQLPAKTSRTSSRPPSTDRKAQRDKSRPGGAKTDDTTVRQTPLAIYTQMLELR